MNDVTYKLGRWYFLAGFPGIQLPTAVSHLKLMEEEYSLQLDLSAAFHGSNFDKLDYLMAGKIINYNLKKFCANNVRKYLSEISWILNLNRYLRFWLDGLQKWSEIWLDNCNYKIPFSKTKNSKISLSRTNKVFPTKPYSFPGFPHARLAGQKVKYEISGAGSNLIAFPSDESDFWRETSKFCIFCLFLWGVLVITGGANAAERNANQCRNSVNFWPVCTSFRDVPSVALVRQKSMVTAGRWQPMGRKLLHKSKKNVCVCVFACRLWHVDTRAEMFDVSRTNCNVFVSKESNGLLLDVTLFQALFFFVVSDYQILEEFHGTRKIVQKGLIFWNKNNI